VSDSVITASGITLAHVRGADGAWVPAVGRA
jgi:hypothetical protein